MKGVRANHRDLWQAAIGGNLLHFIRTRIPREFWLAPLFPSGLGLLHLACVGDNSDAAKFLIVAGADVNAVLDGEKLLSQIAVEKRRPKILELLCAAGATLRTNALQDAFLKSIKCARVLIANGHRMDCSRIFDIPLPLIAFQRGVLACRSVVAAFLRVRRRAGLWHWDKFLLAHISHAVWATRYESEEWAK